MLSIYYTGEYFNVAAFVFEILFYNGTLNALCTFVTKELYDGVLIWKLHYASVLFHI